MPPKYCPLKFNARGAISSKCDGEKCAWYHAGVQGCAVAIIAGMQMLANQDAIKEINEQAQAPTEQVQTIVGPISKEAWDKHAQRMVDDVNQGE